MSNQITFKSLKPLVDAYNTKCKAEPENNRYQELRRALLALRRAINGEEGVTDEELVSIAEILSEAERNIAEKFVGIGMETRALQRTQLADDIDEVVLEVVTVEETPADEGTN